MRIEAKRESELLAGHIERACRDVPVANLGLKPLDDLIGGVRNGRVYVVAGEPGSAKTTLANQMADDLASSGFNVVFVTREVAPHQLVCKSISRIAGSSIQSAIVGGEGVDGFRSAISRYESEIAPRTFFVDTLASAVDIGAFIGRLQGEYDQPVALFVDYLQILPTEGEQMVDERLAIKEVVSGMRRIADSHDIPVFAVSSINRQTYGKRNPGLGALGGSSSIEYAADSVLLLAVDGIGSEQAVNMSLPTRPVTVTALKNRYGSCGCAELELETSTATFRERL